MKIVTVTNQKGGVGKTALALHLALAGRERGLKVLLIDLDTQGSASITLTGDAAVPSQAGGSGNLFIAEAVEPRETDDTIRVEVRPWHGRRPLLADRCVFSSPSTSW